MAKWYGAIGYGEFVSSVRGVSKLQITERVYYGDLLSNSRQLQSSDNLNDNINVANEFSIVSDPYAIANFQSMQYIEFMGNKWKITKVEVHYPRLILTVGGLWNGQ